MAPVVEEEPVAAEAEAAAGPGLALFSIFYFAVVHEKPIRLVAVLGNPGAEYARPRHNIGFMVLDLLTHERGLAWEKSSKWDAATAKLGDALLVKPASYMNRSGHPVFAIAQFYKIAPEEI